MDTEQLETEDDVASFLEEFCSFTPNRLYMLFAVARPKENSTLDDTQVIREIVTHEGKLRPKIRQLKALSSVYRATDDGPLTFRLYVTMNARNVIDAFGSFQKTLIDMQHDIAAGDDRTREFAKRLDEEWKTVLHGERSKDDNYFLVDIDSEDDERVEQTVASLRQETQVVTTIETPNGYHVVVEPFEYTKWDGLGWSDESEVNTDDLLFLSMLNTL